MVLTYSIFDIQIKQGEMINDLVGRFSEYLSSILNFGDEFDFMLERTKLSTSKHPSFYEYFLKSLLLIDRLKFDIPINLKLKEIKWSDMSLEVILTIIKVYLGSLGCSEPQTLSTINEFLQSFDLHKISESDTFSIYIDCIGRLPMEHKVGYLKQLLLYTPKDEDEDYLMKIELNLICQDESKSNEGIVSEVKEESIQILEESTEPLSSSYPKFKILEPCLNEDESVDLLCKLVKVNYLQSLSSEDQEWYSKCEEHQINILSLLETSNDSNVDIFDNYLLTLTRFRVMKTMHSFPINLCLDPLNCSCQSCKEELKDENSNQKLIVNSGDNLYDPRILLNASYQLLNPPILEREEEEDDEPNIISSSIRGLVHGGTLSILFLGLSSRCEKMRELSTFLIRKLKESIEREV